MVEECCASAVCLVKQFRILARLVLYFVFSARLVVVARVLRGRVIVELRERVSSKNDLFLYPEKCQKMRAIATNNVHISAMSNFCQKVY